MNSFIALSILAAASLPSMPLQASAADCDLKVVESFTVFPMRSQLRGHSGTVLVEVSVDRAGRAATSQLVQSSGHRLLDRAATRSVLKWQFDITGCERKDLPATRTVALEYRNDEYGS